MQEEPLISIVSINYNTLKDTLELLESLEQCNYKNLEIFIIDNASRENPDKIIQERYPNIKFIRSDKNLGFAGGNNLGIVKATGDFVFLLNSDTIVKADFFHVMVDFMLDRPEIGIASPKVLYAENNIIQYAGAKKINLLTGRGKRLGLYESNENNPYNECFETDLGHGAALMLRKEAIEKVGLMPEIYFLYYEEHDWTEQIKKAGYKMYYIGTTDIIHKESISIGKDSPLKVYYLTRNRLIFLRRNSSGFQFISACLFFAVFTFPKNTLKYLFKGEFVLLKNFLKGVFWNFKNKLSHG